MSLQIHEVMTQAPVIPVLVAGGLHVPEVTMRAPAALEVICAMSGVAGALVGAGTVLNVITQRAREVSSR